MDTSEIYIKMCDCDEIKKAYQGLIDRGGERRKERFDNFDTTRESPNWILDVPEIISPSITILNKDGKTARRINLLVSDQIQEILSQYYGVHSLVKKFWEFEQKMRRGENVGVPSKSIEQLWLAFYMHEKHRKIWDGDKWVKK